MPLDSQTARLVGRMGAHATHASHDPQQTTEAARTAFRGRFFNETDPSLPLPERLRRAEQLLKLHMARLALRSAQARRKRVSQNHPQSQTNERDVTLDEELER